MTMAASSALRLILGSSSASRRQILSEMGYKFTLLSADIDEKAIRKEKPEELVVALAHAKADAILEKMQNNGMMKEIVDSQETTLMITADQVVIHDGVIREKPSTPEEARKFIKGYSESHAATIGSVLVTNVKTGARREGWDKAEVLSKFPCGREASWVACVRRLDFCRPDGQRRGVNMSKLSSATVNVRLCKNGVGVQNVYFFRYGGSIKGYFNTSYKLMG
ncbi:maf-like protein DDB_G0281937 isoform X1 [Sorghum bicolor]|uniref:maf-like protein DDB_G0281937 isoform X1 n=1 Tax=Sorghum bicolor TaxID=4558 RepID=UPI000B424AFF|nr:maf-like protein DDB_G0281937 isoform X1 [Sorghum bicolor]|eukprot:XP_021318637.1 maf-like protein DDB_G0281937 isoform X1 [Sorghum bicolor]